MFVVSVNPTYYCNFRCKFCFYYAEIEKGRKPEELTLEEIDKVSKSVFNSSTIDCVLTFVDEATFFKYL